MKEPPMNRSRSGDRGSTMIKMIVEALRMNGRKKRMVSHPLHQDDSSEGLPRHLNPQQWHGEDELLWNENFRPHNGHNYARDLGIKVDIPKFGDKLD